MYLFLKLEEVKLRIMESVLTNSNVHSGETSVALLYKALLLAWIPYMQLYFFFGRGGGGGGLGASKLIKTFRMNRQKKVPNNVQ